MITHRLTRAWGTGSSRIERTVELQAGAEYNIDETIAPSANNAAVACALDVSQLRSLFMVASHDMVVETNSGSSPVNTFTLSAGVPFLWIINDGALRDTGAVAVTTDITGLFVTSTEGGTLSIRALVDPTI